MIHKVIEYKGDKLELKEYYNEHLADTNPRHEDIEVFGFKFINHTRGIEFDSVDDDHLLSNLETTYSSEDAQELIDLLLPNIRQECMDCGGAGYSYNDDGDAEDCESCDGSGIESDF